MPFGMPFAPKQYFFQFNIMQFEMSFAPVVISKYFDRARTFFKNRLEGKYDVLSIFDPHNISNMNAHDNLNICVGLKLLQNSFHIKWPSFSSLNIVSNR